jgi:hypothetical protein
MKDLRLDYLFASTSIESIDLIEYTGMPTTLSSFAIECTILHTITGLDRLDYRNIVDMSFAFSRCYNLANTVGLEDWKPTRLSDAIYAFFHFGNQLSSSDDNYNLNLSNWALPSISSQPAGFSSNSSISNLNLPNWGG